MSCSPAASPACTSSASSTPGTTARCCAARACSSAAPRREDYGIAQLEALADGCQLVTTPAPGPYVALPIARELDERLVGEDLVRGAARRAGAAAARLRRARASVALAPFRRAAVDRLVAEQLLPPSTDGLAPSASQLGAARRVLTTSSRVSHARRAVAMPQRMFASVRVRWASESITRLTPARAAARAWMSERSRRSGLALISSNVPVRAAAAKTAVEVDRVGLAALDQAPGRMADDVDQRMLDRGDHALGHRCSRIANDVCTLATTQSSCASSSSS